MTGSLVRVDPTGQSDRRRICEVGEFTIAKGRFTRPETKLGKRLRTNERIRISPVRLIDDEDKQVGIVDLDDAKRRAREAQLDLVEVAPQSTPPVCRIMDYGKWKYQQKKKEHKNRTSAHKSELKGMRLRPKIDVHDLNIKVDKARQFLMEGHKVQFTMLFRGREMAHRELGQRVMEQVCDTLVKASKVETPPRTMGRRMTMVLAPDRTGAKQGGTTRSEHSTDQNVKVPAASPKPREAPEISQASDSPPAQQWVSPTPTPGAAGP